MAVLKKRASEKAAGGIYFSDTASTGSKLRFISTGCTVLDCILGGGWVLGRIANIVGDKSTGKTLLCIESFANFARKYSDGRMFYREAEAAFDRPYAEALGMPMERVSFVESEFDTVEDMFADLNTCLYEIENDKVPALYALDSLDALTDAAEKKRDISDASYGTGKAKQLSQLFRRMVRRIEQTNMTLLVVSQVRSKIGISFGRNVQRTGGHALDFYASQVLYLAHMKRITRTIKGVERVIGVRVKAACDKNKIGLPFRSCEFEIRFGFGIDDVRASVEWLEEVGRLVDAGLTQKTSKAYLAGIEDMDGDQYRAEAKRLRKIVRRVWREVETSFLPKRRKY